MHLDILHTALPLHIRYGTNWEVVTKLGKEYGRGLMAQAGEAEQLFPPVSGWSYFNRSSWLPHPSLECSREVSPPCKEIRVELKDSESNGVYLPLHGEYSCGRQVSFTILNPNIYQMIITIG